MLHSRLFKEYKLKSIKKRNFLLNRAATIIQKFFKALFPQSTNKRLKSRSLNLTKTTMEAKTYTLNATNEILKNEICVQSARKYKESVPIEPINTDRKKIVP